MRGGLDGLPLFFGRIRQSDLSQTFQYDMQKADKQRRL
jgi:hypothetical protein